MFRVPRTLPLLGILAALVTLPTPLPAQTSTALANQVHEVFRKHCAACHGGGKQLRGELNLLDAARLLSPERQLVKPGNADASDLFQLVECGTMPPGTLPKVPVAERKVLRDWIAAGAPPFPLENSEQYALTKILADVRAADKEPGRSLADERYVTLNHLLTEDDGGVSLDLTRAALNKALNQLSTKPALATLKPIDPTATIYRIKLSELGWDVKPFAADPKSNAKDFDPTTVNLYDLLLLDYPLAPVPERPEIAEYLGKVTLLRPIISVRGDWLLSVATQSPLYDELLRLPLTLTDLERRLELGGGVKSARAALTESAVVRGKRLVERRGTDTNSYWRTYDLGGKAGLEGLVDEAGATNPAGGNAIFRLPNGLPGYFVGDQRGIRLDAMPAQHLRDPLAREGVRTGLACMVCHEQGLMKVKNAWGNKPPPLQALAALYPGDDAIEALRAKDNAGYAAALRQTLLGLTDVEPLGPVSRRFQLPLPPTSEEEAAWVMLDMKPRPSSMQYTSLVFGNLTRPDVRLLRGAANSSATLIPIDGLNTPNLASNDAGVSIEVQTVDAATEKPETTFQPGDKKRMTMMAIVVKNTGQKPVFFELLLTAEQGIMVMLPAATAPEARMGVLQPGGSYRFPATQGIPISAPKEGELTKQRVIVYAAAQPFPPGVILNQGDKRAPGESVGGRVVHPLFKLDGQKIKTLFDPAKLLKQTIEFETKTK